MEIAYESLVLGANRYSVQNQKGAYVYLLDPAFDDENPNYIGLEVKKCKMPYALFDQLKAKALPAFYEILLDNDRGSNDTDVDSVISIAGSGNLDRDAFINLFGVSSDYKASEKVPDKPLNSAAVGLVLGVQRWDMEGVSGARVYVSQRASGRNQDQIGFEVIKMGMDYALFDEFAALKVPGEYKMGMRLARAAKDRTALRPISVESLNYLDMARLEQLFSIPSISAPANKPKPVSSPLLPSVS